MDKSGLIYILAGIILFQIFCAMGQCKPETVDIALKYCVFLWIISLCVFEDMWEQDQKKKGSLFWVGFFFLAMLSSFTGTENSKWTSVALWVNVGASIMLLVLFTHYNSPIKQGDHRVTRNRQ